VTTVSHVVNGTRHVSEALCQRVSSAIEELDYQPNRIARGLRRRETHTIGMIIPDGTNPFFAEIARGIEDTSFKHNYSLFLCNSDGDVAKELLYIGVLTENRADGIILVSVASGVQPILRIKSRSMPLVLVDRDLPGGEVDSMMADNEQGGWQATEYLISLGHRRIGCITGPSEFTPSANRVNGYRRALNEAGIAVDEALIVRGDFQYPSGCCTARQLLDLAHPPTAIFAYNDLMAIRVMKAVRERGLRIPEDFSVVGFDDICLAPYSDPPLTTIAQPKYEIGQQAAMMLFERMHNRTKPAQRRLLETHLVIRQSTAAAKGVVSLSPDPARKGVSEGESRHSQWKEGFAEARRSGV